MADSLFRSRTRSTVAQQESAYWVLYALFHDFQRIYICRPRPRVAARASRTLLEKCGLDCKSSRLHAWCDPHNGICHRGQQSTGAAWNPRFRNGLTPATSTLTKAIKRSLLNLPSLSVLRVYLGRKSSALTNKVKTRSLGVLLRTVPRILWNACDKCHPFKLTTN